MMSLISAEQKEWRAYDEGGDAVNTKVFCWSYFLEIATLLFTLASTCVLPDLCKRTKIGFIRAIIGAQDIQQAENGVRQCARD
ncbi:MAG: hypothetical protein GPOALKHO_000753 [Sodalis sp.]|nr:MAG: hypothetical protein GPOALKHO_000753 [Sodalis sp.]